jgi:hypothetical protein
MADDEKKMKKRERDRLKEAYAFWYEIAEQAAAEGDESFRKMLDNLDNKLTTGQFRDATDVANWLDSELATNPYWNSLDTDQRESDVQKFNPATTAQYESNVKDRRDLLEAEARRIGFTIDDAILDQLATEAQRNNWTDEETRSALMPIAQRQDSADMAGEMGNIAAQLSDWATRNGLDISEQDANSLVSSIAFDEMDLNQVKSQLRQQYMIGAYPAWAEQIQQGFDVYDLSAPYRGLAQRMLGRTDISMADPIMKQMMQYQDEGGSWKARPLWEAEKFIRNTDEWQYTDDAYDTYASVGARIGKMFGFG